MPDTQFTLMGFQATAAESLSGAALAWIERSVATTPPRYGVQPIPFVGQLRAVTGSGKTPILAQVVSELGHAVILWTAKSSAVVEQTFRNLQGKYRSLLPADEVRIIRDVPSPADWDHLIGSASGLTIWVLTTAAWNEAEAANAGGDVKARLNLHRPQPDWSGESSPWSLLSTTLVRPLWIVSDESHNQSSVQLDILAGLRPMGFFLASATPIQNDLFAKWQEALAPDPEWSGLLERGVVRVMTRDVVAAELLKTTIELYDNNSGYEEDLDDVLAAMKDLDAACVTDSATVTPRAIYVVEKSNVPKGSPDEPRPVLIWRYLRSRGVPADQIAIYTNTREVPEDAEQVSHLSQLQARHRHIIFNQALQEGWDDPEAYVCYFDGRTNSFVRIRQIVGRILRQPGARSFQSDRLNTATVFINTPTETFDSVLSELQAELRLYGVDDETGGSIIRVRTRRDPLPAIAPRPESTDRGLTRWSLRAPNMAEPENRIRSRGASTWSDEFLEAPGQGQMSVISLEEERVAMSRMIDVVRSARTLNGAFFRRRLLIRNRSCLNAIHPDSVSGLGFAQFSCHGSVAQAELADLVDSVANYYEDRVEFDSDPDPDQGIWRVGEFRPKSAELITFSHAVHPTYSRADFNLDEIAFARAIDAIGVGTWMRNPATAGIGYSIPLPVKSGDSTRFYPDFLWWTAKGTWAIDTTGKHLLTDKVRGKLMSLGEPAVALVVRGQVDLTTNVKTASEGWTSVVARNGLAPSVRYSDDLESLLRGLID